MTLIDERPLYNLATTGGHESDRDLMSYIRGVSGEGNESGENAHIARQGADRYGLERTLRGRSAAGCPGGAPVAGREQLGHVTT